MVAVVSPVGGAGRMVAVVGPVGGAGRMEIWNHESPDSSNLLISSTIDSIRFFLT